MQAARLVMGLMAVIGATALWSFRRKREEADKEADKEAAPEENTSKALVPYNTRQKSSDAEEILEQPPRYTGWLMTFSTSWCDAATLYRYGDTVILALTGNVVAITTIVNTTTYIVTAGETFFHEEVPGLRVCLTTTFTLELVSGEQIAWELGLAGHSDEDAEEKLAEAIYHLSGYCVPLSVMSWA